MHVQGQRQGCPNLHVTLIRDRQNLTAEIAENGRRGRRENTALSMKARLRIRYLAWRVQIAEYIRRKSGGVKLSFIDYSCAIGIEQCIDLVSAGAKRILSQWCKFASVDSAQRLPSLACAGDRDDRVRRGVRLFQNELEKFTRHEWQVHREDQVQLVLRGTQGRMDAAERSAVLEEIFDDRTVGRKSCRRPHDCHCRGNGSGRFEHSVKERAPVELDEGLISSHARALSASENESGGVACGKHAIDDSVGGSSMVESSESQNLRHQR